MTSTHERPCWAYRVPGMDLEAVDLLLTIADIEPDGLSEEDGVVTVWFTARPPQQGLPPGGTWTQVDAAGWATRWREWIRPLEVGRVRIVPPWLATAADREDPLTLLIEPGMAFGTGHHATTAGCLAALQGLDLTGRAVADIGTGTGVLALAAEALGASTVVAVDTDPDAVAVARANVSAHGSQVQLHVGSCEAVAGPVDVVVANLTTATILALHEDLLGLLAPDGWLVLSGVGTQAAPRMREALQGRLEGLHVSVDGEWATFAGKLKAPDEPGP